MWPFYQCCDRQQSLAPETMYVQENQPVSVFFDYLTPYEVSKNQKSEENPIKLPNIEEEFFNPLEMEEDYINWDKSMMKNNQNPQVQQQQIEQEVQKYQKFQE